MNGISILTDTNPIIYLLDGNAEVADFLDEKQVWLSVISELELFGKRGLTRGEIKEINALLDNCFIAELTPQVKKLVKDLMQKYVIRLPDAIIAATALYLDLPLFSADVGFRKISGLKLILFEL
jgi:predicted nucleic acid-binding protein